MLTPLATTWLMRGAVPLLGRGLGTMGRMAPRNVTNSLSRTAIAVAALMVSVSVTIGVGLMIGSFRHTVIVWLDQILQGDVYISVPAATSAQSSALIDPQVIQTVAAWPGVERLDMLRTMTAEASFGPVDLVAVNNPDYGKRAFRSSTRGPQEIWEAMQSGAVVISEPLANRLGMRRAGAEITLSTAAGPHTFPVVGIYYDYASSRGTVSMALDTYRRLWGDESITALGLNLAPGLEAEAVVRELERAVAPAQRLSIRSNRVLRAEALAVFDRTFAITGALQLLATLVAFIGVLSALLSLQLEKQREIGILRAIGLTARQLWGLVMLETGLMGAVAGLLAMPTGFVLALILIYIINRRSFGWTLQLQVEGGHFIVALLIAVTAALLAGIYPARKMSRMLTAEALKYE